MADTGNPAIDGVNNMVTALRTQQSTWGLKKVYDHPGYRYGEAGPALSVELDGLIPQLVQVGGTTAEVEWTIGLRIVYFTELSKIQVTYRDVLTILGLVGVYLLENPRPNGYGNLLLEASAFGPEFDVVPTKAEQDTMLFGGSILAVIKHTRAHTIN